LTRENVPEQVNIAYGETRLTFGKEYIIPKPFDPRLLSSIPIAVAKAAVASGVAKMPITDWDKYKEELLLRSGNDNKIVRMLHNRAKLNPKKIVFAEADHLDVLKAAQIVYDEGIAIPILLGHKETIVELKKEIGFDATIQIIDPKSNETREKRDQYATKYWDSRKRSGVTFYGAQSKMKERNYFGAMMVVEGDVDGMISGYTRAYPTVVKPIFELIGKAQNVKKVATVNIMTTDRGPLFLADTAINIDPTPEELAEIAQMTANVATTLGFDPIMAMLSYSNFGSSSHLNALKVRKAVEIVHAKNPNLLVDGELQSDFALNMELLQSKFPFSKLAGKKVNTLIFPNLESGNITYKLLKELHKSESIGPIIMGLSKAVHIVQLGASVNEIVNMTAIAVIDVQERQKRKNSKAKA
jgi:malate dehydrogenase (oxaloacetate-decarboxylating)(NADP+)